MVFTAFIDIITERAILIFEDTRDFIHAIEIFSIIARSQPRAILRASIHTAILPKNMDNKSNKGEKAKISLQLDHKHSLGT